MRVLHVHSGNLFGGVESTLLTLVREAGRMPDMESAFALAFDGRFSRELRALGRAPYMTGEARLSRPHSVRSARAALRARLAMGDIDVVVCQQPWSGVVFGSVAREMGYPYVLWVHMASDGRHWLERIAKWSRPDAVICNSRFTDARVEQWLPRVARRVVYCPVAAPAPPSPESRRALRRSYGVGDTDVVIVMAARAEAWKGHQVLLDACARLAGTRGWACWLAGSAQLPSEVAYLESLRRTIASYGLTDRVSFLGEREDMPAVLAASDVYCQPNLQPEPFGLSLVEAMYAGLPVVTTAAGGALEIVDATCGDLLQAGDVAGVAEALRRLVDDRARRERMGVAGRQRAGELCDPQRRMTEIAQTLSRWSRPAVAIEAGRRAG
jgi:glycosyltransferase involved in cell wall biosynthesis